MKREEALENADEIMARAMKAARKEGLMALGLDAQQNRAMVNQEAFSGFVGAYATVATWMMEGEDL
jgi:fluoride ion exporter CrcB/FEX